MALKAFWINDCDCYAGETVEDALQAAINDSGNDRDFYDSDDDIAEADGEYKVNVNGCDGDEAEYSTIADILKGMTKAGMVCTTEWQ